MRVLYACAPYGPNVLRVSILQGFEDEDVKVAEKPKEPSQLDGFLGKISQAINWVPDKDK